jgi:hypothetical protein
VSFIRGFSQVHSLWLLDIKADLSNWCCPVCCCCQVYDLYTSGTKGLGMAFETGWPLLDKHYKV